MRTSPSSLKVYKDCPRKWAFKSQCGLPKIDQPHFLFGTNLHRYAEAWLLHGTAPDSTTPEGKLFLEGIPFLPHPGVADVELPVAIWIRADGTVGGRIGLGPDPDEPYVFFGYVDYLALDELGDHKSSADPKRYGLTDDTHPDPSRWLINDLAAIIYSASIMHVDGVEALKLRWTYYDKRKKTAAPVDARVTREDNLIKLKMLRSSLDEMTSVAARFIGADDPIATANTIPNRPAACDGFGRFCDFADHCEIYPKENVTIMSNSRLDALKAKIAASKETANAPEAKSPEVVAAVVAEVAGSTAAESPAPAVVAPVTAAAAVVEAPKTRATRAPKSLDAAGTLDAVASFPVLGRLLAGQPVTLTATFTLT